jgi:hypothetical protein
MDWYQEEVDRPLFGAGYHSEGQLHSSRSLKQKSTRYSVFQNCTSGRCKGFPPYPGHISRYISVRPHVSPFVSNRALCILKINTSPAQIPAHKPGLTTPLSAPQTHLAENPTAQWPAKTSREDATRLSSAHPTKASSSRIPVMLLRPKTITYQSGRPSRLITSTSSGVSTAFGL